MVPNDDTDYDGEILRRAKSDLGVGRKVRNFGSAEGRLAPLAAAASQIAGAELLRRATKHDPSHPNTVTEVSVSSPVMAPSSVAASVRQK
jgi:hypothetical protein